MDKIMQKMKGVFKRRSASSFPSAASSIPLADGNRNTLVVAADRAPSASSPDLRSTSLAPVRNVHVHERCASAEAQSTLCSPMIVEPTCEGILISPPDQQQLVPFNLPKSPWERAIEKLKPEDRKEFRFDDPDKSSTLADLLESTKEMRRECEEKQWKYRKANGEEVFLRHVVDGILKNLNKFMAIGDTAIQQSPQPVGMIWSTFRFLLQVAANDTEILENLMSDLKYISGILHRCVIYESLYGKGDLGSAQNFMDSLPGLYAAILTYLWRSKRYFSRKTPERYVIGVINSYTAEFQPLMEVLQKLEQSVENAARAAAYEAQAKVVKDDERFDILKWLSEVTYEAHHEYIKSKRQAGTGNWLLEKKDFTEWRESTSSSILWLHGIAGAGKTTLASYIIDEIASTKPANHALAYFYCKYGEKDRQDPESILRCIVKQLSVTYSRNFLSEPLVSLYRKRKDDGFKSGSLRLVESKELILQVAGGFEQTIIIIDALDECDRETRKDLLAALEGILRSSAMGLKVFVTSRDDDDIVLKLDDVPNIYIQSRDNSSDIELFVVEEVERCIAEKELLRGLVTPELKQIIIDTLTEKANGMFLWVYLQLKHISRERTETAVKAALRRLPKDLEATYSVIWDRICEDTESNFHLAQQTLKWIMCAKSPLACDEMIEAVSIKPMQWKEHPDHDGITEATLLAVCQNLVVVDKELGVFRSAHFRDRVFAEKARHQRSSHGSGRDLPHIALCCQNHVKTGDEILGNYALRNYVMKNWAEHIRLSGSGSNILMELQKMFFRPSPAYYKWIQAASEDNYPFRSSGERWLTPLWIVCYYGLWSIFEYLTTSNDDCITQNASGSAPLHAIVTGQHEAVDTLLFGKEGVRLSYKNYKGRIPLHAAAMRGHEAIVKKLLGKEGADLNCKDDDGWTPLYSAVVGNNETIVRLLLEKEGVDPNCKNNGGWTPLFKAVVRENETIVRLLLEKEGVDLNCKNNDGWTPLFSAVVGKNETIVRLLLEKEGVDPNCKDNRGWTPLLNAVVGKKETITRLLLGKDDVDLNYKFYGSTPRDIAARAGNLVLVKLLDEAMSTG